MTALPNVKPRYATPRSDRPSYIGQANMLAYQMKRPLMPWQFSALDQALEYDPATGLLWYDTIIITVQRQAGKSVVICVKATHRSLMTKNARLWYTAQRGIYASQYVSEEYSGILGEAGIFKNRYFLSRKQGAETIQWWNGSRVRAFPPKRDALHSKQADDIFIDEAWAFDQERGEAVKQAARPTMLTRPDPQLWIVSTLGDDQSVMMNDYVDVGRESLLDPNSRVLYIDYGIPEDADPEDLDVIAQYHPAYGHTVTMEALKAARRDFGADVTGWARAYGNRASHSRVAVFPAIDWSACRANFPPGDARPDSFALAFDVTPDGKRAAISAAWRDKEGTPYVEVIRESPGFDWVAEQINALCVKYRLPPQAVGCDSAGILTLKVVDELRTKFPKFQNLKALTTTEYATSCATITSAVVNHQLRHFDQEPLNQSVIVASRRPMLDGGYGFGRRSSSGSIAPLISGAVALHVFDKMPKMREALVIMPTRK